ncbi:MAG TPA: sialidase family protein [Candidatus Binatia bacterium]|nr:sialidase family protein [Candidatus Binatia bacterium]
MKPSMRLSLAILSMVAFASAQNAPSEFPVLKGPYLGQTPPDIAGSAFAPGIIPISGLHTAPVFTADGTEVYWKRLGRKTISMMKIENGVWCAPREISLSARLSDFRDPCLSPDGKKLFFLSKGILPFQSKEKENIWCAERKGDGWSEPQPLTEAVNRHDLHWQVSVAANGNLYFASFASGIQDIYCSEFKDGRHREPQKMGRPINGENSAEWSPYIAPDEKFLLFTRANITDGSMGSPAIYISSKDAGGNWGEAKQVSALGPHVLCPQLTLDKQYLFFLGPGAGGDAGRAYWIPAKVIEH